jgi:hypothetical protein
MLIFKPSWLGRVVDEKQRNQYSKLTLILNTKYTYKMHICLTYHAHIFVALARVGLLMKVKRRTKTHKDTDNFVTVGSDAS